MLGSGRSSKSEQIILHRKRDLFLVCVYRLSGSWRAHEKRKGGRLITRGTGLVRGVRRKALFIANKKREFCFYQRERR